MKHRLTKQADGRWRIEGVEVCAPHDYYGDKWDAARCAEMYRRTLAEKPVGLLTIGHNEGDGKQRAVVGRVGNYRIDGDKLFSDFTDLHPRAALMAAKGQLPGRSPEFSPSKDGKGGHYIPSVAMLAGEEAFFNQYADFPIEPLAAAEMAELEAAAAREPLPEVRSAAGGLRAKRAADGAPMGDPSAKPDGGGAKSMEDRMTAIEAAVAEIKSAIEKAAAGGVRKAAGTTTEPTMDPKSEARIAELETQLRKSNDANAATQREVESREITEAVAQKRSAGFHITAEDEADLIADAFQRPRGEKRNAFVARNLARFSDEATRNTVDGAAPGPITGTDEVSKAAAEFETRYAGQPEVRKAIRAAIPRVRAGLEAGHFRDPRMRFQVEAEAAAAAR